MYDGLDLPSSPPMLVQPCATPYGTNLDGSPITPENNPEVSFEGLSFDQGKAELQMAAAGLLDGYAPDGGPYTVTCHPDAAEAVAEVLGVTAKVKEPKHMVTLRTYNGPLKYTTVPACEHKFILGETPRHCNCESCWFAFFQTHGEVTQTADKVFAEHGVEGLKQLQGKKFTKHFLRFMGTLAVWKAQADAAKETNDQRIDSTTSGDTDARESAEYLEAKRKELSPYEGWVEADIT